MRPFFTPAALIASAFSLTALAAPVQAQDAEEMVRQVRLSAAVQQSDLSGVIRKDNNKQPVSLFLRNENIQFNLGAGNIFHIRMGDEKCDLMQLAADGTPKAFPDKKLVELIPGTDLTYEDLTLRFLYWPGAKLEGTEKMRGEECYRIRLDNPRPGNGAFGAVYVWIHKKYGAFWTIRAFDRKGVAIKEFLVTKVMQLPGGKYTLKQMQINQLDPQLRVTSITYLEFNDPAKPAAKGPKR